MYFKFIKNITTPQRPVLVMHLDPKYMQAVRWSTDDEKFKGVDSLWRKSGCKNKEQKISRMYVYTVITVEHLCIGEEEETKDAKKESLGGYLMKPAMATYCAFHSPEASFWTNLDSHMLFSLVLHRLRKGAEFTQGQNPYSQPLGV